MDKTREKLVELLSKTSCRGDGESLGSCPDRKYGMCGEVANLSYCVIQNIANHLIANGVTLQEHDRYWATEQAYKNGYEQGKKDAVAYKLAPTEPLTNCQQWIPVSERFPKEGEEVLVFGYWHEKFKPLMCYLSPHRKGEWFTTVAGQQVYEVTHWMPLPEPPKGEHA